MRSVEVGGTLAGIPLPLTFAVDSYQSLSRKARKLRRYRREDFAAIDDLRFDPPALKAQLPYYLGVDIQQRLETKGHRLLAFYDGYVSQAPETRAERALWLTEFIRTLHQGVHAITTREPLRWDDGTWRAVVERVQVDTLPDRASRRLIRETLGRSSSVVEDHLIRASGGLPFFLQSAIDAYALRGRESSRSEASDLPASPDSSVAYLLAHLGREERDLVVALATVQVFDAGLHAHLGHALRLPVGALDFDDLVEWFFVEDMASGLYKTHDLLTDFVRSSRAETRLRQASLDAATRYLLARCREGGDLVIAALPLFAAVMAGWTSSRAMPPGSVEVLVDVGYQLYDAGYWNELASVSLDVSAERGHPIATVSAFFVALASRRTEGTAQALARFKSLETQAHSLGRHRLSVELEGAYLGELAGNYSGARESFRELDARARPFDPTDRTHLRARLHHADILLLDGRFHDASRLVLEASEALGPRAPLDWAELVRHRGHVFRFCFLLREAEDLYVQAIRVAAEAPALVGKLQTNLAETYCWSEPERALDASAVSREVNVRLGNRIELVKCDVASAIALAKLGDFRRARNHAAQAAAQAREVGYPAGAAFAQQAWAMVEGLARDDRGLGAAYAALTQSLARLGTYSHLRVAPAWLAKDPALFAEVRRGIDWLSPEELEDRLSSYLGPRSG